MHNSEFKIVSHMWLFLHFKCNLHSQAAESSNNNYSDAPDGKAVVDRKLADTERELDAMKHSLKEEREKYTKQIEALKKEVEAQVSHVQWISIHLYGQVPINECKIYSFSNSVCNLANHSLQVQ